jgi:hypothetical protein
LQKVSQELPKECPRDALEALGFVFGEDADDIFVTVKFPDGWDKKATDHSMWSDLLDDKGRRRGNIFYKAAFYDRSAHMRMIPRFNIIQDYELDGAVGFVVTDCDEVITGGSSIRPKPRPRPSLRRITQTGATRANIGSSKNPSNPHGC